MNQQNNGEEVKFSAKLNPTSWSHEPGSGAINLRYRWVVRLVFWALRKLGAKP